ncbi:tyrosine-type recombinase/integrase [Aurantibacter sp.]|uniref:tyrosine-type recombinase/integrase n=1 Tax=Aurantibacter sp. TaxID=2807103 RepID=UPI0035C7B90E
MSIKSFSDYLLLEKNYSKLTVNAYVRDLEFFKSFLEEVYSDSDLSKVNYAQIRSWIVSMVENDINPKSINRKISGLNSYFKFLIKIEDISDNPLAKHKVLKTAKKIQVPFSEEEVENVINNANGQTPFKSVRNKLIVELFYSTGIRRAELINIKLNHLDLNNKTLKVIGKRNKERIIPLIPSVIETIYMYVEKRKTINLDNHSKEYLFLTQKGKKIYDTLLYRLINSYFSLASTKKKKSPHMLRHSFATHLLNQGAELNAVKELLGHSSLASTQVYTHNNIKQLTKVYKNAHPRSKYKK